MARKDSRDINKSGFDEDFLDWVKYNLYNVNAGNHCSNPPHPSWYNAANFPQNKELQDNDSNREPTEKD